MANSPDSYRDSIGHFSLSFSMSASALIAPELRTQTEFTLSLLGSNQGPSD